MDKGRYAKDPLLYIHQVRTEKINANMQEYYRSSRTKSASTEEKRSSPSRIKKVLPVYNHNLDTDIDESEEQETDQIKNKNFLEMTVEEQLIYLTDKPSYAPRLVCEIRTDQRSYRGVVLSYQNGIVTIRSGRRSIEIPREEIERIRLLSL